MAYPKKCPPLRCCNALRKAGPSSTSCNAVRSKKNCETLPVALCNSLDKMLKKWHSVGGPLTNLSLIGTGRLKEE